ncbi:xaa-Pro aminopeptidase 3-like [Watersipora subatra]|uniref:xaa-Pro aminopeptidase 3-like n=1 Tax=Watersipora subatra TaxID=2589382 RepID=UPI00355C8D1C
MKRVCSWRSLQRALGINVQSFHSTTMAQLGQPCHATHPDIIGKMEVTPRITQEEYRSRRIKLANAIRSYDEQRDHVVIIPSHDRSYMSAGVPFIYRQHSNMTYLTGFLENESALVMNIDKSGHTSTLFVKEHTEQENLWEGERSGRAGALEHTAIDDTDNIKNLELHLLSSLHADSLVWYNKTTPISRTLHEKYLLPFLARVSPAHLRNADSAVDRLRLFKSPAEEDLMRKCGDLTAEMFMETMRFSVDNPHEHALFAKFDYECRIKGASNLAYLPVIAGGSNALAVHYIRNDRHIDKDSMVLVDCGCDLHGYVSDVTRTWPVSGKFSSAQKEMYEAVEEVYKSCLHFCQPGVYSLNDIFSVMMALIGQQLERLGIVTSSISNDELSKLVQKMCPHHVGHWLGMDVHDTPTVSRSMKLQPHQVICIEPGLYFGKDDQRVPKEMRGVGIRIEDNILITENGYENLNTMLPTSVKEIESLLNDD